MGQYTPAQAHPRAGGENDSRAFCGHVAKGSSPRGRGKRRRSERRLRSVRLIPARAGKTSPDAGALASQSAHPRAGGENNTILSPAWPSTGSSPRGRGKLCCVVRSG